MFKDENSPVFISFVRETNPNPNLEVVHSEETKSDMPDRFIGPTGVEHEEMTTCSDLSKHAKFNPYSVTDEDWFSFYFWSPTNIPLTVKFFVPTKIELSWLKSFYETHSVTTPINWGARLLIMMDKQDNHTYLMVETDTSHGNWLIYCIIRPTSGEKIEPIEVVMKQTADNRYLGLMQCKDNCMYVFSRMNDVPPKRRIQDAAATMGYRARGGKSYLYQGHQWMPIPEDDDKVYWLGPEYKKRRAFDYFFHDTPGW